MQTFLPYQCFLRSARALDRQRLGKQRLEAKDCLLLASMRKGVDLDEVLGYNAEQAAAVEKRFQRHPCVDMWQDCLTCLARYGSTICTVWIDRGYNDNQKERFDAALEILGSLDIVTDSPWWLGKRKVHGRHRAMLHHKSPERYPEFKREWLNDPWSGYWWPEPCKEFRRVETQNR